MKRVYCQIDEHNSVIEVVRGEGIILPKDEIWHDVTEIEGSENLTEGHLQRRTKVFPGVRHASGHKKPAHIQVKHDFRFRVDKRVIKANGEDAAIIKLEPVDEVVYEKPIKVQVNGKTCEVVVGEELRITSVVNQRIGIKGVDPDVKVIPKVFFIQATGRGKK